MIVAKGGKEHSTARWLGGDDCDDGIEIIPMSRQTEMNSSIYDKSGIHAYLLVNAHTTHCLHKARHILADCLSL